MTPITSADIDNLRLALFMAMACLVVVMVRLPVHIDTSCECNGAGCEWCVLADD